MRSAEKFRARYGADALVAGASEGIGEAFARALAARGVGLMLVARRPPLLDRLAGDLRAAHPGLPVRTLALDLGEADAPERVAQACAPLDLGLLVYNAAFAPTGPFHARAPEDHDRVLAVNCRTPMLLARSLGARFAARGRGGIVLMSSLAGLQGSPGVAHYAATKAYCLVLAEGLWAELAPRGVDVLACCAGPTRTPGYAQNAAPPRRLMPRVLEPAEVAEEALAALGRTPVRIPGAGNRIAAFLMTRLFSRRRAVELIAKSTQHLGG